MTPTRISRQVVLMRTMQTLMRAKQTLTRVMCMYSMIRGFQTRGIPKAQTHPCAGDRHDEIPFHFKCAYLEGSEAMQFMHAYLPSRDFGERISEIRNQESSFSLKELQETYGLDFFEARKEAMFDIRRYCVSSLKSPYLSIIYFIITHSIINIRA